MYESWFSISTQLLSWQHWPKLSERVMGSRSTVPRTTSRAAFSRLYWEVRCFQSYQRSTQSWSFHHRWHFTPYFWHLVAFSYQVGTWQSRNYPNPRSRAMIFLLPISKAVWAGWASVSVVLRSTRVWIAILALLCFSLSEPSLVFDCDESREFLNQPIHVVGKSEAC